VSLGLSGLFGALSGLTHTATTVVMTTATQGGDLAHSLGLTDPTQVPGQSHQVCAKIFNR
jgi:hypothetical protein